MTGLQNSYHAHWYDLLWNQAADVPQEVTFLREWAIAAGRVVGIGAGTGRIALHLAAMEGVHVYAVEPDAGMCSALLTKLAQTPHIFSQLTLLPNTGADFTLFEPVSLIYGCGVLFYFLTDAEQIALLQNLYHHLRSGGRLVIDSVGLHENEQSLSPTIVGEIVIGMTYYRATMSRDVLAPTLHRWRFVYEIVYQKETIERVETVTLARVVRR